jgi:putative holliday junction resolvase
MSDMGGEHIEAAIHEPLLGVDTGDVRIGIAIKSADVTRAEPVCVIKNETGVLARIAEMAQKNKIETVVVGLPRDINGNETAQTRKARSFAGELADESGLHIILHDEFATSERARERLGSLSREEEKAQLDAMAAAILLDDYMESMVE